MKQASKLMLGDNMESLKKLPDNCIDSIVTDPPYGLSFMGKKWDYDVPSVELWKEVIRVLKPGGHVLSFGGTRTYHRMVVNMEDAGFEIRDQIMWLYASGFPKSHNIGKSNNEYDGWGTALKPANEPICLARKPLSEKTVAANVIKWKTGGINIDGCRVGDDIISTHNAPKGTFAGGDEDRGSDTNSYSEHQGRFPANLILDEEAGKMLGEPSRFFYCAKVSKKERNLGLDDFEEVTDNGKGHGLGRICSICGAPQLKPCDCENNHWITPAKKNTHPTIKPVELMRYLCRLITPKGGLVLDPYMGSGSTGIGALLEGFRFCGMEMDEDYFKIAEARIKEYKKYDK